MVGNVKNLAKQRFPGLFKALKRTYYRIRRLNPFISSRYMYVGQGKYLDLKNRHIKELKPNLFIIGAEKSGTTSLHNYLDQHPDIFMSKPNKEPQLFMPLKTAVEYFNKSDIPIRNKNDILKNHMLKGYQGENFIGESTTTYTRSRLAEKFEVPKRLYESDPQAKIIYILRNPLERALSNYLHGVREGNVMQKFHQEINRTDSYLFTSLYAQRIKKFYEYFSKSQILVLEYEEFADNPQKVLGEILGFLSLHRDFQFNISKRYNVNTNRNHYKKMEFKFSEEKFNEYIRILEEEKKKLEIFTGKKFHWTYRKSDWVKNVTG